MQVAQNTCKIQAKLVRWLNQTFGKAAQVEAGTRAYLRIIDGAGLLDFTIMAAENWKVLLQTNMYWVQMSFHS